MTEIMRLSPLIFFGIAFLYSMGGFAGESSYLLVLTLAGTPFSQVQATALFCNLAVSSVVFTRFHRAGSFKPGLVLPFAITSVPAAYLGAMIHLPKEFFTALLGFSLFMASLRILFSRGEFKIQKQSSVRQLYLVGMPLGAAIGFLSGVVGVGGGIFLCPVLLLLGWANIKEASAAASFFIFVNSLSGLMGQAQKGFVLHPNLLLFALCAVVGGFLGSGLGSKKFSPLILQRVLASILSVVSLQLLSRLL